MNEKFAFTDDTAGNEFVVSQNKYIPIQIFLKAM